MDELEERYRQAESVRLSEQEEKERELEVVQCKLEELEALLQKTTGQVHIDNIFQL